MKHNIVRIAQGTVLGAIIIVVRLAYLQLYCGAYFFALSKKNYERIQEISPLRGEILDCHGIALATNRPIKNIYWQGTGNYILQEHQHDILRSLEGYLNISLREPSVMRQIMHSEKTRKEYLIAQDVTMAQLSIILEQYGNHPNLVIHTSFKRYYPHNALACHVLGYMQHGSGKMGIEKAFDNVLRGSAGRIRITMNSLGTPLHKEQIEPTYAGATLTTTLDISLQLLAEYLFSTHVTGSFLLFDPRQGDVKAVISRPDFDPNVFVEGLSCDVWQDLQLKKPFINRAFCACYPPASIFKLVTAAAALEQGIITTHDVRECKGYLTFGDRFYYCMKKSGHRHVSVKEALALSCNPFFYSLGQDMSVEMLADYAARFGLGLPTQLVLPEKRGLIPTSEWKQEVHGEQWWPGETLCVATGQSYVLSTPLQIARMMSSIFEGYLVRPRILLSEKILKKKLEISDATLLLLQDSMRLVVTQETGKNSSITNNITIWAKTGTAQTSSRQQQNLEYDREYAWFVGYFYYKQQQPLVMVVLLENVTSPREAIIFAKKFLQRYCAMMQQQEKTN